MSVVSPEAALLSQDYELFADTHPVGDDSDIWAEYKGTLDLLRHMDDMRMANRGRAAAYNLPSLPDVALFVGERIEGAEGEYVSKTAEPDGYRRGTAEYPDHLLIRTPQASTAGSQTLLAAEHATDHVRSGNFKDADYGVGGLAAVLSEDLGTGLILPRGWQTGDANYDADHPIKKEISRQVQEYGIQRFVSIHGLGSTPLFHDFMDEKPIDIIVGIGKDPSEGSREAAQEICRVAAQYELRAVVNLSFVRMNRKQQPAVPERKASGEIATRTFAASLQNTTRSFAERTMQEYGVEDPIALQVEYGPFLRALPTDVLPGCKRKDILSGIYLGYQVLKEVLEK